ncbi:hypothetical protein DIPPA_01171 [Diplonema papillatum]|nr:hypothetical protein DIPPA_02669 [Diplonema papillatum]KAJ9448069.1 hypothetical protein DIPPA_01171 [Diplonema papillatum]
MSGSPLPTAERYEARFPARLREAWSRKYASDSGEKLRVRVQRLQELCVRCFGPVSDSVLPKVLLAVQELLGVPASEVAECDLVKALAILDALEGRDPSGVTQVVAKVTGRTLPAAPEMATMQVLLQQQQEQLEQQRRQQQQMMTMMTQMQAQLMGLAQQPPPAVASATALPSSATPIEADAPMDAPIATATQPAAVAPRVFVKEAKDVQSLANAIEGDPEGLVRDLEVAYVCGRTHLAGGELLESNFNMLRSWVLSVSATVGWLQSPDQLRLGNDLLTAVRMQRLYVEKGHSRRDLLRQIGTQAEDALDKAEAVLDSRKEKHGPAKKMAFKPRTGNAKAGGK